MPTVRHLLLLAEHHAGQPVREPVHVEELPGGEYLLLFSPGLVLGLAAGDRFRLLDSEGRFEGTRRGGNLAVQVFSERPLGKQREGLVASVVQLGGKLDGEFQDRGLVFTIPVSAGFPAVEAVFNTFVAETPGTEWFYGNVYDPSDGVTPLNWWTT